MIKKIIALGVLIIGAFFTFVSHSVHLSLGLSVAHIYHVGFGIILILIGGWMLIGKKN